MVRGSNVPIDWLRAGRLAPYVAMTFIYGLLVFAPLGPEQAAAGAVAGLIRAADMEKPPPRPAERGLR